MKRGLVIAALATASCGGQVSDPPQLDAEQQEARYNRCRGELTAYEASGLVKHGGARPGVDTDILDAMSEDEQQEFAETVACVAKAGQVGASDVEVTAAGMQSTYRTYQALNAK